MPVSKREKVQTVLHGEEKPARADAMADLRRLGTHRPGRYRRCQSTFGFQDRTHGWRRLPARHRAGVGLS